MTSITINTSQPVGGQTFINFENEFSAGLCECCADIKNCIFAYCCFICFECKVHKDAGECLCTPIFCPASATTLRTKIRQGYRIRGEIWKDYLIMYLFPFCAYLQMANELKVKGDAN